MEPPPAVGSEDEVGAGEGREIRVLDHDDAAAEVEADVVPHLPAGGARLGEGEVEVVDVEAVLTVLPVPDGVGAAIAALELEDVGARAAPKDVVAAPAIDPVVAGAAAEPVVAAAAVDLVVAAAAPDRVAAGVAVDVVVAEAAAYAGRCRSRLRSRRGRQPP